MPKRNRQSRKVSKRLKPIDMIRDALSTPKELTQEESLELIGGGKFYCGYCDRYFLDSKTLTQHEKQGQHRRMFKLVSEQPYTKDDSELYGGLSKENSLEVARRMRQRAAVLAATQ